MLHEHQDGERETSGYLWVWEAMQEGGEQF